MKHCTFFLGTMSQAKKISDKIYATPHLNGQGDHFLSAN